MNVRERAIELGYNPNFYRDAIAKREREAKQRLKRIEREKAEERARKAKAFRNRMAEFERMKQDAADRLELMRRERFETSVKEIISMTAEKHGMDYVDIVGNSRSRAAVLARHEAIGAVALAKTHLTSPQIGKIFNRDHTTILHALRKMGITR